METTQMPIERGVKKLWYTYSMEYDSSIKNNEILPFATQWSQLETIKLSERCQS